MTSGRASTEFAGPVGNATDKYGDSNRVVRALLERFLKRLDAELVSLSPRSILDVGCGEGVVTERFADVAGVRTVGVDSGSLREDWSRREGELVSFLAASAYDLPFDDGAFDCVCAIEVLEHLERPRDALAEMARVAARTMLVSVPREPIWRLAHLLAGRDVRTFGNTPGHLNHWSAAAFRSLVSDYGSIRSSSRPFPWTIVALDVRAG